MKVIFLDIDGVLNLCYDYLLSQQGLPSQRDDYGSSFHPHFVENLKRLIEETDAKIVISSTWRLSGLSIMKEMWKHRNLPGEIIDITPCFMRTRNTSLCRGDEIQEWLNNHIEVTNYVYIDDDHVDVNENQLPYFIKTADNCDHIDHVQGYGLTKECTEKAIQILKTLPYSRA
jgi:hypothetical protein